MLSAIFGLFMTVGMFYVMTFVEIMVILMFTSVFFFMKIDWSWSFLLIGESMGVDGMSFLLIELSLWVSFLIMMASMNVNIFAEKLFFMYVMMMMILLVFCFSFYNYMGFYVFFESVLFPIMMLIMGWGYQPERLQAGIYMFLYTLFGSLPLFLLFLCKSDMMSFLYMDWEAKEMGSLMILLLGMTAFLVSMPMFLVHLWLPKAHVEAPVGGSMILAGVLLKLGIYGMFRVKGMILMSLVLYSHWMMSVLLLGGVIISLICLCQVDMKSLIAYSSVCHMGLALGGFLSFSCWGAYGSLLLMIGHGLCSSGLFCLANMYYERFYTRSIVLLKGLGSLFPYMAVWWFIFSVINMAAPPSMNLGGEILLIGSIMSWSVLAIIPLGVMSFFSAAYSLYMYSYVHHGSGWVVYSVKCFSIREMMLMFLHFIPLLMWILKAELFSMWG
uniref:NADH-ubiquinone oxidoreductase chain 4 n=1 Tax=Ornithodoros zumpti TaxID=1827026 RepID=A0A1P8AGD3_9ACAR|nr:NADH dehydrogenase subunit 4 [Ornithodoros zumpti]AMX74178.1 NADH dehydrogenase subunit 4 [Ornithodoros zumpti]UYB78777.1 NADH dehydrogenase subunit 4 [Ornithodoros zumpti]